LCAIGCGFFTTARYNKIDNNIAGMTYSVDPTAYTRVADPSQSAFDDIHQHDINARMTVAIDAEAEAHGV